MQFIAKCLYFKAVVVFCAVWVQGGCHAQQPSYEVFGSKELAGLTVYDQLMGDDDILYIATDDGVYTYNSIEFEKIIPPKNVKGRSYFNLKADKKGRVYCSNLNGQLFRTNGRSLQLLYELPDSLVGSFTPFVLFDTHIVITGKRPVLLNEDGQFERFLTKNYYQFDSDKIFAFAGDVEPLEIGILEQVSSVDMSPIPNTGMRCGPYDLFGVWYQENRKLFGADRVGFNFYGSISGVFQNSNISFAQEITKGIRIDKHTYWAKIAPHGVLQLSGDFLDTNGHKILYPNLYMAPQELTKHGVFLGSDGTGIYLVKNRYIENLSALNKKFDIVRMLDAGENGFVIVTAENKVILVGKDLKTKVLFEGKRSIYNVTFDEELNFVYILTDIAWRTFELNTGKLITYNQKSTVPIKRLDKIDKNSYQYAGTFGFGELYLDHQKRTIEHHGLSLFRLRSRSCKNVNEVQYFGTYAGIQFKKPDEGQFNDLKFRGKQLVSAELLDLDGTLIIYTLQDGLLVLNEGNLEPLRLDNQFVDPEEIRTVFTDQEFLLISTKTALIVFNCRTNETKQIGLSDGLLNMNIKNAFVFSDTLYVLTNEGIQIIALSKITNEVTVPKIRFDEIRVNNSIENRHSSDFDYWQNKLTIRLVGDAFGKQPDTKYKYRLRGLDDSWYFKDYFDNSIEYQSLPPGNYTLYVVPVYKGQDGEAISYSFRIRSPFWQTWWFYLLSVVFVVAVSVFTYWRYARRRIKKISVENQINRLRLVAIQSQMNPHFIFNSINAIQETALNNDGRETYRHINKFSKLVRLTMYHSNREFVSLQEEMELIKSYLDLEKIRFSQNFKFEIHQGASDQLLIPPLLIQPIIENAIIHGLFHKDGDKELIIRVEQKSNALAIIVEDNGIGRFAAAEIKKRQQENPEKSFATGAIEDRLSILKEQYKGSTVGITYIDLKDAGGKAIGTRVELLLPKVTEI